VADILEGNLSSILCPQYWNCSARDPASDTWAGESRRAPEHAGMPCLLCSIPCIITCGTTWLNIALVSGSWKVRRTKLGTAGCASLTLATTTNQRGFHPPPQHPGRLTSKPEIYKGGKDLLNSSKGIVSFTYPQLGDRQKARCRA
jgi:hypothetical protein